MLKFITITQELKEEMLDSNTSHVKVYPHIVYPLFMVVGNSNTSHVKVYLSLSIQPPSICSYSNTSHVKVYQLIILCLWNTPGNSNTSHVKVYPNGNLGYQNYSGFKYISC